MSATNLANSVEKGLPTNVDAERFVLGSILLDESFYIQAAGTLEADDFSLEKHRRIFRRMGELQDRGEKIGGLVERRQNCRVLAVSRQVERQ